MGLFSNILEKLGVKEKKRKKRNQLQQPRLLQPNQNQPAT